MCFLKKRENTRLAHTLQQKFKRIWAEALSSEVGSRDFSKAYKFISKHNEIQNWALLSYFNFKSEDSPRFKEVCDAINNNDITRAFLSLREFNTTPLFDLYLANLTGKMNVFLSDKRKESVVVRHSVNWFIDDVLANSSQEGEAFVKKALLNFGRYEELLKEKKYKSASKLALLSEEDEDYASNMKKYLYYVCGRTLTEENAKETVDYINYVKKYFSFMRRSLEGELMQIADIDILIACITFVHKGGKLDEEALKYDLELTVKTYCLERLFTPVCLLADYLYLIGEVDYEKIVLDALMYDGETIIEKYHKRFTYLDLIKENPKNFIFRHSPKTPIECLAYDREKDDFCKLVESNHTQKEKNCWTIVLQQKIESFELVASYHNTDKILFAIESNLDREFGDYVLEKYANTYFNTESQDIASNSIIIVTSGKNKYTDFPKIGFMVKVEPISQKYINVRYCLLYFPDEEYNEKDCKKDSSYIAAILERSDFSRFKPYSKVVEKIVWDTVRNLVENM